MMNPKNLFYVCCIAFSVSACSSALSPDYKPVILEQHAGFQADVGLLESRFSQLNSADRLLVGMTISDARCDKFFEDLEKLRADARLFGKRIAGLETGLPALLEAASASSLAVAAVSSALGFVAGWLSDYDELILLAQFKGAVYKKWQAAKDFAEAEVNNLIEVAASGSVEIPSSRADRELYKYSRLCLRSQLVNWLHQAADGGELVTATTPNADAGVSTGVETSRVPGRRGPTIPTIRSYVVGRQ